MDINEAWESTFKIIFGECNLKMDGLEDYLFRYLEPVEKRKSTLSDKDIYVSESRYCANARVIGQEEHAKMAAPFSINDIKDMDSLVESIQDRLYYEGNKAFGNSEFIRESDTVTDSFHVLKSHNISASKYVAYSAYVRDNSEYAFGSGYFMHGKYLIKVIEADNLTRCFESYISANCSDMFFTYNCFGCTNAMFSFSQRAKKDMIGNLALLKDKYLALRKKLVDESREYLEKHKTFPSMFESLPLPKATPKIAVRKEMRQQSDMKPIEKAWESACRTIFGKEMGPLSRYEKFLSKRVHRVKTVKTVFGSEALTTSMSYFKHIPPQRVVTMEEADELGKKHIEFGDNAGLAEILEKTGEIAFLRTEIDEGGSMNNPETRNAYVATNTYQVCDAAHAKNCAYDTFALSSEAVFGSYRAVHSKFCIGVHSSVGLTGCLEMDSCTSCSNSMFCHNCENLDNCMFCFNAKSLRYAIGNVELGRENYMKLKKMVMGEITARLEKDGTLPFDIFSVGCYKPLNK